MNGIREVRNETENALGTFIEEVKKRNRHEPEFIQAVYEVSESIIPYIEKHPIYKKKKIHVKL